MASNHQQQQSNSQRKTGMDSARGRIISMAVLCTLGIVAILGASPVQQQVQWGQTSPSWGMMVGGVDSSGIAHGFRVDVNGNLLVSSTDADGQTPAGYGLLASGVDSGGVKRVIKTDTSGNMVSTPVTAVDPCQDPQTAKNSVAINVSGAGTTQPIPPNGSQVIYPCEVLMTVTGTAPTFQWTYGTGATCGSGTVTLTGAISVLVSATVLDHAIGSIFKPSASAAGMCLTLGGTLPNAQGKLLYVQK
jgi:hypothetical protein